VCMCLSGKKGNVRRAFCECVYDRLSVHGVSSAFARPFQLHDCKKREKAAIKRELRYLNPRSTHCV
jgi:hypothetical protein